MNGPTLTAAGYIELPRHEGPGGFDHADILGSSLYVAHTANNSVDVIDLGPERYLRSIADLKEAAGVLTAPSQSLVFTSNRGEDTVAIFTPGREHELAKVAVGVRPNGLAYAPTHHLLLAANVGRSEETGSFTVSFVDVEHRRMIASVPVSGKTRWAVFDPPSESFFINISDPPEVIVGSAVSPGKIAGRFPVPAAGPHGLAIDALRRRLHCTCDAGQLVTLHADTGQIIGSAPLPGKPDVTFFNEANEQLYVAIGDPGCVEVIDTATMRAVQRLETERGGKTMAFDQGRQRLYVFLPETHRAMVVAIRNRRA